MSNIKDRVVIVGAGHAGGALSGYLRQYGFQGPITLVGTEITPPYQRPPLSKGWLKGATNTEALLLKAPTWYGENRVALRLGCTVVGINREQQVVQLYGGECISYDHLVFATGASARKLDIEGSSLDGVTYLRDLTDAETIKSKLRDASRLAIVGGGYIGLEVAATARYLGVPVVVVEREQRLLARSASPAIALHLRDLHGSHGVHFLFGARLKKIEGTGGRVSGLAFVDGSRLACDAVLVGIGACPNSGMASMLNAAPEDGIVVDANGQTSCPGVWAIGDVTRRPLAHFPGLFRLESVPSALEQARRVACAISGRELPPDEIPWFWSDQFDTKLQIAGMPTVSDESILRGNPAKGKFTVFHFHDGRLSAAECVNSPGDFLASKKAIAVHAQPERASLSNSEIELALALTDKPRGAIATTR